MLVKVKCEVCGNEDLKFREGFEGFYCSKCDELCEVSIENVKGKCKMTNEQMIEIMQKAVNKYGEKQLDIAQEELAELIQAISKYKRAITYDDRKKALESVFEELADVYIMAGQIELLFTIEAYRLLPTMLEYKLRRLDKRMENE